MSDPDGKDLGGMTCREFVELVTNYLEDRLDAGTRVKFEDHLTECPGCTQYLDQIRETTLVLGRVTLDSISTEGREHLLAAFRSWRSGRFQTPG